MKNSKNNNCVIYLTPTLFFCLTNHINGLQYISKTPVILVFFCSRRNVSAQPLIFSCSLYYDHIPKSSSLLQAKGFHQEFFLTRSCLHGKLQVFFGRNLINLIFIFITNQLTEKWTFSIFLSFVSPFVQHIGLLSI